MRGNAPSINVRTCGAKGDGIADDTRPIQQALNVASLIHFPPGTYRVSNLSVPAERILEGIGFCDLLISGGAASRGLSLDGSNISLRNMTIRGTGVECGVWINLDAGNLSKLTIERCQFTQLDHAIRVKALTTPGRTLSNLYVTDNRFEDLEERALDLTVSYGPGGIAYAVDNLHIERNHFEDIAEEESGPDNNDGAIYIGGLTSVTRFFAIDNVVYRAAPQFICMAVTTNPRLDFVIKGNVVRQQGPLSVIHMGYQLCNIDNLLFDGNSTYYVEFEHLLLNNCRNFKVTNSHFEDGNVGVAVSDGQASNYSYGEIVGNTFVDIECPTAENSGNKAIFLSGNVAEVSIANCRFRRRDGVKPQVGIDINYETSPMAMRLGVQIATCSFEGMTAISVKSGGGVAYPGHARVLNCTFKRCTQAVAFTYALGNVVAFCAFEGCDSDVVARLDVNGLRCYDNLHVGTNAAGVAGNGAYVVAVGAAKSLWQIEGCTFRNVKGLHVLAAGTLLAGMRTLVWANHDVDGVSTGGPVLGPAVVGSM